MVIYPRSQTAAVELGCGLGCLDPSSLTMVTTAPASWGCALVSSLLPHMSHASYMLSSPFLALTLIFSFESSNSLQQTFSFYYLCACSCVFVCLCACVRAYSSWFLLCSKQPQQPAFIKLFQAGLLWVSVCLARVADCFLLARLLDSPEPWWEPCSCVSPLLITDSE